MLRTARSASILPRRLSAILSRYGARRRGWARPDALAPRRRSRRDGGRGVSHGRSRNAGPRLDGLRDGTAGRGVVGFAAFARRERKLVQQWEAPRHEDDGPSDDPADAVVGAGHEKGE